MSTAKTLLFVALYYLVWFCCIGFAKSNQPNVALMISIAISALMCSFFTTKDNIKTFTLWFVLFTCLGYTIDTLLQFNDVIQFKANTLAHHLAPTWILALWLNFAVLCFGIKDFLRKCWRYLPLFGLLGFPLAYSGGIQFGVASFTHPYYGPVLLGLIWCAAFPLSIYVLNKLESTKQ